MVSSVRGVRPGNTDPTNISEKKDTAEGCSFSSGTTAVRIDYSRFKLLSQMVDTYICNVRLTSEDAGSRAQGLHECLYLLRSEELTSATLSERCPEPTKTDWLFCGEPLYLAAHATRSWSYLLENDFVSVVIGRGGVSHIEARVTLRSVLLAGSGFEQACVLVDELVWTLYGVDDVEIMPSEVHLALDFCGVDFGSPRVWLEEMEPCFVRRSDTFGPMPAKHGLIQTVQVGSRRGPLSAVIYNKSAEIREKSGKTWLYDIYDQRGYHAADDGDVWRLELRFRREYLGKVVRDGKVGISDWVELSESIPSLLAYGLLSWLQFKEIAPGASALDRSRAPLASWWEVLAVWNGSASDPAARDNQLLADAEKLMKQAVGCFTSAAAVAMDLGSLTAPAVSGYFLDWLGAVMAIKETTLSELVSTKRRRYMCAS